MAVHPIINIYTLNPLLSSSAHTVLHLKAEKFIYFSNCNKQLLSVSAEWAARKFSAGAFAIGFMMQSRGSWTRQLESYCGALCTSVVMAVLSVKPTKLKTPLLVRQEGRKSFCGFKKWHSSWRHWIHAPALGRGCEGILVLFGILGNFSESQKVLCVWDC